MAPVGPINVVPMVRVADAQSTITVVQVVYGYKRGMEMAEATQSVAKHFSVLMRDAATGLGAVLTAGVVAGIVIQIKKGNASSYTVITPTATIIGTTGLLDLALTASHLDTLGVAAVNVTGPGLLANDDLFVDVALFNKSDGVRAGLTALPSAAAGASGGLPTLNASLNVLSDLQRWVGTAPAALTTNGFVQAALLRWLTDNAGGTPNALLSGRVDANVGAAAAAVDANVTKWLGSTPDALSSGKLPADVKLWLASAPDALSSGKIPADVKLWLATAPAAVSASGFVQSILRRWLTDDAGGTPLSLDSNLVQAEVSGTTVTADVNVVKWLGATPTGLASGLVPAATLAIGGSAPAAIAASVLDAARSGHVTLGSVGEGVALGAALLQGNFFMDSVDNTDPNGQTSARLRVFHTGAAAGSATPGGTGEGEFATFTVTTTYAGPGKITTHRVTQQ